MPDENQPIWFSKRQRLQQDGIYNTEDCRVCSNTQRENDNDDETECATFVQAAQRVLELD
jgi:hypothetical protein